MDEKRQIFQKTVGNFIKGKMTKKVIRGCVIH